MSKQDAAIKTANENNFESASFYGLWKGFDVYSAYDETDADDIPIVGYPTFILVGEDEGARLATPDETFEIMDIKFAEHGSTDDSL